MRPVDMVEIAVLTKSAFQRFSQFLNEKAGFYPSLFYFRCENLVWTQLCKAAYYTQINQSVKYEDVVNTFE